MGQRIDSLDRFRLRRLRTTTTETHIKSNHGDSFDRCVYTSIKHPQNRDKASLQVGLGSAAARLGRFRFDRIRSSAPAPAPSRRPFLSDMGRHEEGPAPVSIACRQCDTEPPAAHPSHPPALALDPTGGVMATTGSKARPARSGLVARLVMGMVLALAVLLLLAPLQPATGAPAAASKVRQGWDGIESRAVGRWRRCRPCAPVRVRSDGRSMINTKYCHRARTPSRARWPSCTGASSPTAWCPSTTAPTTWVTLLMMGLRAWDR